MTIDDNTAANENGITPAQHMISILWPSFLVGSLTTILFFTFFDPTELGMISGYPEITRIAGYSMGFFFFWFLSAVSSALTCYFRQPCHQARKKDDADESA